MCHVNPTASPAAGQAVLASASYLESFEVGAAAEVDVDTLMHPILQTAFLLIAISIGCLVGITVLRVGHWAPHSFKHHSPHLVMLRKFGPLQSTQISFIYFKKVWGINIVNLYTRSILP